MFHRESGYFKTTYRADQALYPLPIARWTVAVFAVLALVLPPMLTALTGSLSAEYYISIVNFILIAVVGALGLNILVGYTGQISIGHGAFMSVGAYTAANLAVKMGLPFWLTLPAAGLMAAAVGAIVGVPSLRIKGLYLAIATLAAQLIIEWTINHVPWISGGSQASIEVPRPELFGLVLKEHSELYYLFLAIAVLAIIATLNLMRSRIGRAFVAIRDQDIAAEIIGIDIFKYKMLAFAISSFYAGITGVLTLPVRRGELRELPDHDLDRLSGDDHHRRSGLGAGIDLRRDLRHAAADRDPRIHGECRRPRVHAAGASAVIPAVRLGVFGLLIIVFLVLEPEGLNRLWRNIRSYFRVWPFSY